MRGEDHIQSAIVRFLDRALPGDSYFAAIPNGFRKTRAGAGIAKATGLRAGAPDLFIVTRGLFIGLEVKTAKGRLQDSQKDAADRIVQAGGLWSVVRSVEDVERFLRASGVALRASVLPQEARPIGEIIQPIVERVQRGEAA